jgi:hypothetical protein
MPPIVLSVHALRSVYLTPDIAINFRAGMAIALLGAYNAGIADREFGRQ